MCLCVHIQRQTGSRVSGPEKGRVCLCIWGWCCNDPPSGWREELTECLCLLARRLWIINMESASQSRLVAHYRALLNDGVTRAISQDASTHVCQVIWGVRREDSGGQLCVCVRKREPPKREWERERENHPPWRNSLFYHIRAWALLYGFRLVDPPQRYTHLTLLRLHALSSLPIILAK